MANSPSNAVMPSPKLGLPTEHSIKMEEEKANHGFKEFTISAETPPSNFQKVTYFKLHFESEKSSKVFTTNNTSSSFSALFK